MDRKAIERRVRYLRSQITRDGKSLAASKTKSDRAMFSRRVSGMQGELGTLLETLDSMPLPPVEIPAVPCADQQIEALRSALSRLVLEARHYANTKRGEQFLQLALTQADEALASTN